MNNKEVAHLWANQSRDSASGSHFYFQGDTIYSYGSHFPIARHYKGCVLFTNRGYSVTTSKHIGYTRFACSHLTTFTVANPLNNPGKADVALYKERIADASMAAAKAKANANTRLEWLQQLVNEGNDFCQRFGFKTRFSIPNLDELKVKAAASAAKEKKQAALKRKRYEAKCAETVAKWLAGEDVQIPGGLDKVYLRLRNDVMQTSRGATVPIDEAHKAYRFAVIQRERGWHRNGDQFQVGDYHLDAVNAQGVIAGCHRIGWDEIERFAAAQGW